MSLAVWLPLNGDLHNQGLNNNNVTRTVAFNNNGKIGSCLESTSLLNLNVPQSIYDVYSVSNTEISYCLWIKIDKAYLNNLISTTDFSTKTQIYNKIMGFNQGTTSNGIGLHLKTNTGLTQSTTLNTIFVYGRLRNGSQSNGSTATEINLDQWYHLCVTYDKSNVFKFYINGVLIASKTIGRANLNTDIATKSVVLNSKTSELSSSESQNVHLLNLKEYINDVRIYDHALSAKEVEEIAKGLVLHYKLDNNGLGEENLTANTSTSKTLTASGTSAYCTPIPVYSQTEHGAEVIHNATASDIFTVSFDYEVTGADTAFTFAPGLNKTATSYVGLTWISRSPQVPVGNSSGHFVGVGTLTADQISYGTKWLMMGIGSNNRDISIKVSNFKFEKGSVATFWSPAPSDTDYPTDYNTTIYDCSGYSNNGTIVGNLTAAAGSPRYDVATYTAFGNTDYVQTPTLNLPGDQITLNFWFKSSNKTPGSDYHMPLVAAANSNSAYEMSIYKTGYLRGGLVVAGTRKVDNCTSTKLTDGSWHMCTMTYDGATIKRYVDAVMEKSTAATGSLVTSTYFVLGHYGSNTSYYSKETYTSDVRIYTTALTADQVKELYTTSMSIDSSGNVYARELVEL